MAVRLGDAVLYLAGDRSALDRTLQGAERDTRSWASRLGGTIRSGLTTGVQVAAAATAAAVTTVGAGLAAAAVSGVSLNATLENTEAKLRAFTGSADEAAAILQMVRERAARTPFAFNEMADAAAALLPTSKQLGIGLEELIAQAEILAATNPAEGLAGAAFALREAASGDMQSVIERFNLSRTRLNELKAEGVPALDAIRIALAEMGIDASIVAELGTTLTGRWSTFLDTVDQLKVAFSRPVFDLLKSSLERLQPLLDNNMERLTAFATQGGEMLARGLGRALDWLSVVVVPRFQGAWSSLERTVNRFQAGGGGVAGLVAALSIDAGVGAGIIRAWERIKEAVGATWTLLADSGRSFWQAFTGQWSDDEDAIRPLHRLAGNLGLIAREIAGRISEIIAAFGQDGWRGAIRELFGEERGGRAIALVEALDRLKRKFGEVTDQLAKGGLVERLRAVQDAFSHAAQITRDSVQTWREATSGVWEDDESILPVHRLIGNLGLIARAFEENGLAGVWEFLSPHLEELRGRLEGWIEEQRATLPDRLRTWASAFWEWTEPARETLVTKLGEVKERVVGWIDEQRATLPERMRGWWEAFVAWTEPAREAILERLGVLRDVLLAWLGEKRGEIEAKLTEWRDAFLEWIGPATEEFLKEWPGTFDRFLTSIEEQVPALREKLSTWAWAFTEWIVEASPDILAGLAKLLLVISTWIVQTASILSYHLITKWVPAFLGWLRDDLTKDLPRYLRLMLRVITDWIRDEGAPAVARGGRQLGESLWGALDAGADSFIINLKSGINEVIQAINEAIRIFNSLPGTDLPYAPYLEYGGRGGGAIGGGRQANPLPGGSPSGGGGGGKPGNNTALSLPAPGPLFLPGGGTAQHFNAPLVTFPNMVVNERADADYLVARVEELLTSQLAGATTSGTRRPVGLTRA